MMKWQGNIKTSLKNKIIKDDKHISPMHREDYLTDEFVNRLHNEYFQNWKKMPHRGKSVVLGIDLQNYFLREGEEAYLPSAPRLIEKLKDFYSFAKKVGVEIVFTRHCHENNILARWWKNQMRCNSPSTEIYEELLPFADIILEKNNYDAFYGTNLEDLLREKNVATVIITGVMTHLCCETTAREAFVRGFNVIFPIDGTATQNAELHEGTIRAISHGFAPVPVLKEVEAWLKMR